jgi:hypothetical protein
LTGRAGRIYSIDRKVDSMAKRERKGRCVHCLSDGVVLTDDHLFPKSWYPETTPLNLEKWKIPACRTCNHAYGRLEQDLFLGLGLCVDANSRAAAGVARRAVDAMDPRKARSPFDALRRRMTFRRIQKRFVSREFAEDSAALLPEINPNRPRGAFGVLIPGKELHRFGEKVLRGMVFMTEGRYVEPSEEATVHIVRPDQLPEALQIVENTGEIFEREPGIRIRKAIANDNPKASAYVIDIWDQFRLYGMVLPKEWWGPATD